MITYCLSSLKGPLCYLKVSGRCIVVYKITISLYKFVSTLRYISFLGYQFYGPGGPNLSGGLCNEMVPRGGAPGLARE